MKQTWLFAVSLSGMAVSAAVLMLYIPSLFHSGEQDGFWPLGVFTCLTVAFAVGARYWRPSISSSDGE